MDPSGRARRLPVETGVGNGGMVGSSGRTGGFLSGDGSGGAIPRNRFPLTFGGTGGTSVLGTGPWAPTFRPVDPYFAREEHAARFETVRTDWDMRGLIGDWDMRHLIGSTKFRQRFQSDTRSGAD